MTVTTDDLAATMQDALAAAPRRLEEAISSAARRRVSGEK